MKKIIALLMVVAMVLCFAGCGAEEKTVVVGYTIYEPMNYLDENGELIGYDTDLAKAVFGNLGYKVVFQEINWDNKYTDLDSGAIDCVWNGFTCNTADKDGIARADKVDFSYNYMENRQVIVTKKDAGITKAEDLNGKFGAAESGSAGETYGKSFEGATIKGFTKQTDCLLEVVSGTVDFVLDTSSIEIFINNGIETISSRFYILGDEFKTNLKGIAKINSKTLKI